MKENTEILRSLKQSFSADDIDLFSDVAEIKSQLTAFVATRNMDILDDVVPELITLLESERLKKTEYLLTDHFSKKLGELEYLAGLVSLLGTMDFDVTCYRAVKESLNEAHFLGFEVDAELRHMLNLLAPEPEIKVKTRKKEHSTSLRKSSLVSFWSSLDKHERIQDKAIECLSTYLNIITSPSGCKRYGSPRGLDG